MRSLRREYRHFYEPFAHGTRNNITPVHPDAEPTGEWPFLNDSRDPKEFRHAETRSRPHAIRIAPLKVMICRTGAAMNAAIPPRDRSLAAIFWGVGFILRLFYIYHFRIDSDEPQHLHVVWGWANGLIPYRDIFDNHAPVFQALCAPLFHLFAVRADILLPMRLAMLPLFILTVWCVWKIAMTLFTPRTALWTAVLAALYPPFFFTSIEFRPDELWTLLWLAILALFVCGRVRPLCAFGGGVLLGLAFCVSMKTTLLLAALALAITGALVIRWATGAGMPDARLLLRCVGAGVAGMIVVPIFVVGYFAVHGATRDLYYCVIEHNVLPQTDGERKFVGPIIRWLVRLVFVTVGVTIVANVPKPISTRIRITFIFLAASIYYATLVCFWPIVTAEDFLPFFPTIMITAAPSVLWLGNWLARRIRLPSLVFSPLCVAVELVCIVTSQSPFENQTADKVGIVADALRLTESTDFVMDSKGETIYRRRPFRYVLEGLTFRRLHRGLIIDDIAATLVATRTPLATTRRMPKEAREFIKINYLPIAFRLRVLGKVLRTAEDHLEGPCVFDIAVPHRYTIVTPSGQSSGSLDGTTFDGPRELGAGRHVFQPVDSSGPVVVIWANAVERGYSPFAKIKEDSITPQD